PPRRYFTARRVLSFLSTSKPTFSRTAAQDTWFRSSSTSLLSISSFQRVAAGLSFFQASLPVDLTGLHLRAAKSGGGKGAARRDKMGELSPGAAAQLPLRPPARERQPFVPGGHTPATPGDNPVPVGLPP